MQKSGFILIAIIVIGLALGPLTYFSGLGGGQELEPANETEQDSDFYVASANFTGQVKEVEPYVYFEGIKDTNDIAEVKGEVSTVLPNATNVSVNGPNLVQNGWKYTLKFPVQKKSRASEIGFQLSFNLARNYNWSVTYRKATAEVPSNFTGKTNEGKQITIYSTNKTVKNNLVYSEGKGEVKLTCPKMIVSKTNQLVNVPARCGQSKDSYFNYGITQDHFQRKGETRKANTTLENLETKEYAGRYQYPGNLSNANLSALQGLPSELYLKKDLKVITAKDDDLSEFNVSEEKIKAQGFMPIEKYKVISVDLPNNVTFNGTEYKIEPEELDTGTLKVPFGYSSEDVPVEAGYRFLYGEIFAVNLEYRMD